MFERPQSGERAILVHLQGGPDQEDSDLNEFESLAVSAGANVAEVVTGKLVNPSPATFIGKGKLDELRATVQRNDAELVLFDHQLSPGQERNLERELRCRVVDRTGLILDIFAQRAQTHEGKLQVELAQLSHLSTRLIRGWTHLERQKGGIGLRGPGETQLESDRRLLRERMRSIRRRLEKVRGQRGQARRSRLRAGAATVSLIGYTNAGKSTLFNRLTAAGVQAEDRLFATLDPTMRKLDLKEAGSAILVDTVGFIRQLPHQLVESFRATLEETAFASLLLHVVDAADPNRDRNIEQVQMVLDEIGAQNLPVLMVYNKTDLLEDIPPHIDRDESGRPRAVWISAESGDGLSLLCEAIGERLSGAIEEREVTLGPEQGGLRASLYRRSVVVGEHTDDFGRAHLRLRMPVQEFQRLAAELATASEKKDR